MLSEAIDTAPRLEDNGDVRRLVAEHDTIPVEWAGWGEVPFDADHFAGPALKTGEFQVPQ